MVTIKQAKLNDLKGMEGRENALGGPCFSLSALEMFMKAPDFAVLVGGGSGAVLYHEGKGGKSRTMLLVGQASPDLIRAVEASALKAGTVKVTAEIDPASPALEAFERAGFRRGGEVANYFGKGRPAVFIEKDI